MYIISYDIENDRIRRKIAKTLEDYGKRVQYSVFECNINQSHFEKLYTKLSIQMQEEEKGSIRIYNVCRNCEKRTVVIGVESEELLELREETIIV